MNERIIGGGLDTRLFKNDAEGIKVRGLGR